MSTPIEVKPSAGGRLMTSVSADTAGIFNYTVKRDFRRVMDRERRVEGEDLFAPSPAEIPETIFGEDVTLIAEVRSTSGRKAPVIGTPTKLYRYQGDEIDEYAEDYVWKPGDEGCPQDELGYWMSEPDWAVIGSGYSGGTWRWANVAGRLFLTNGIDPVLHYGEEDIAVEPVYELWEQGIATAQDLSEHSGCLVLVNITQMNEEALESNRNMRRPTQKWFYDGCSSEVLESTTVNPDNGVTTYTINTEIGRDYEWTPAQTGLTLTNGTEVLTDAGPFTAQSTFITIAGIMAAGSPYGGEITTQAEAYQQRVWVKYSAATTWTVAQQSGYGLYLTETTLHEDGGPFWPGYTIPTTANYIEFDDGLRVAINWIDIGGNDYPFIDGSDAEAYAGALAKLGQEFAYVYASSQITENVVNAAVWGTDTGIEIFSESDVGQRIIWDTGDQRLITGYIDGGSVAVDFDGTLPQGTFRVTVAAEEASVTGHTKLQYRTMWSIPGLPTKHGALVTASMRAGSPVLTYAYASRWIKAGITVVVPGAGADGGNLISKVLYADDFQAVLENAADTAVDLETDDDGTVTGALVADADSIDAAYGFEDLIADGSEISRCMSLGTTLVLYRPTAIVLMKYTGNAEQPMDFYEIKGESQVGMLHYKQTLASVSDAFHIYAGSDGFYKFDLVTRTPQRIPESQLWDSTFLKQADKAANMWAAVNTLTSEVFIAFGEQVLRLDYLNNTASVSPLNWTAGGMITRPKTPTISVEQQWFIGGHSQQVVRYGLVDGKEVESGAVTATRAGLNSVTASSAIFLPEHVGFSIKVTDGPVLAIVAYVSATEVTVLHGDEETEDDLVSFEASAFTLIPAIWHRLTESYTSELKTGLEAFGTTSGEKTALQWTVVPGSESQDVPVTVDFIGANNPAKPQALFSGVSFPTPNGQNSRGMAAKRIYFGSSIQVAGRNNPFDYVGQIWHVKGVNSRDFPRRVTNG